MPPRNIRPKNEPPSDLKDEDPDSESKSSKRRVVSSACIPCRKRKSKCDGAQPACATCTAVYRTRCYYDAESDHRRKGALKRDNQSLQQHNDALDVIIASLRSFSESDSIALLHTLRSDIHPDVLADTLRTNVSLPQSFAHQTLEADFAELLSAAPAQARGGGGGDATTPQQQAWADSLDDRVELSTALVSSEPSTSWFRTPQDAEFVEHLLHLYFYWVHPFYPFFSREHFLRDMSHGSTIFCSGMLLNAILAFACHYSDRTAARTNPRKPATAGDDFFAEAKHQLDANSAPSLTTVQALGIMSLRETSCGRESNGYQYAGRCVRMALEMGLHISLIGNGLRFAENEVRRITFWSVFNLETISSVSVGRLSQLPRAAADVQRPTLFERIETQKWEPYADANMESDAQLKESAHSMLFLNELSSLSELASDMVNSFYAPREPFTSRRLATFHARYQDWYQNLPEVLWLENTSLPHVLVLHMYYFACILHLFRPYIKLDLSGANLYPHETCTACANKISGLMNLLRSMYGLRRVCLPVPSLVLSASTIHLLNLPAEEASSHLRQDILNLQAMSTNHRFADRCIDIIHSLAAKWSISLPVGISTPLSTPYDRLPPPSSSHFWTASIPQQDSSAFASNFRPNPILQQQQPPTYPPFYGDTPMDVQSSGRSTHQFWTPFPSQTIPAGSHDMLPSMSAPFPRIEEASGHWRSGDEAEPGSATQYRSPQSHSPFQARPPQQPESYHNWQWQ